MAIFITRLFMQFFSQISYWLVNSLFLSCFYLCSSQVGFITGSLTVGVPQKYLVTFSLLGSFYIVPTLQKDYKEVSANATPKRNKNIFKMASIYKFSVNIAIVISKSLISNMSCIKFLQ